ncbi:YdiU family protein [Desulfonatronum sp. SC1]|uniref:protein adenylyltransferase SelO n=1 Tax=Desulfonatronum sp. SC1 TaxID=2109626 RepID=UPI000D2F6972|nr:YdiU family protein [Desulfonatronum sp. SC1]PTN36761.1 YdiU family protein [Desulfonatronum sp. SC1]
MATHDHATAALAGYPEGWRFDNSYARLPEVFFSRLSPVPVRSPRMVLFNRALAELLGLNGEILSGKDGAAVFSGNRLPAGAEPIAQAYAGHQFGYFTMLGDGRAILLGEQITPRGERFDIQFKGSGRTPFSRGGDGRAALGPMLREYIVSEAMHALGVPTTRALAVTATGEPVPRESELAGAILTRVASSHIRVGTFEFLAAQGALDHVRTLADYTLRRHYPDQESSDNPPLALLRAVMERQAALVAKWMLVGFVHGVMNTDNMALSGETIDYGPCAFMDAYDPATVFSSIDQQGRYAYGNQPRIAQWNLARFAETLAPLLDANREKAVDLANEVLETFPDAYRDHWLKGMRAKLGLVTIEDEDADLIQDLLTFLHQQSLDYTNTLRDLADEHPQRLPLFQDEALKGWLTRWRARLNRQPESSGTIQSVRERMRTNNPAVIPRNHRVEEALEAAELHGDMSVTQRLLDVLVQPYVDPVDPDYRLPPPPSAEPYKTFCGT